MTKTWHLGWMVCVENVAAVVEPTNDQGRMYTVKVKRTRSRFVGNYLEWGSYIDGTEEIQIRNIPDKRPHTVAFRDLAYHIVSLPDGT